MSTSAHGQQSQSPLPNSNPILPGLATRGVGQRRESLSDTSSNFSGDDNGRNPPRPPQNKSAPDLVVDSDDERDEEYKRINRSRHAVHTACSSLLSSSDSAKNSYRGFVNLCIITLVLAHIREVIANLTKYGWMISYSNALESMVGDPWSWPMATTIFALNGFVIAFWMLEFLATIPPRVKFPKTERPTDKEKNNVVNQVARGAISRDAGIRFVQIFLLVSIIAIPFPVSWSTQSRPAAACIMVMTYTVAFMKYTSYVLRNGAERRKFNEALARELQRRLKANSPLNQETLAAVRENVSKKRSLVGPNMWPHNVGLKDVYYFTVTPTLCYETHFPRAERMRRGWTLRRIGELIILSMLIIAMAEQYIIPLLDNAVEPMKQGHILRIVERWLKLSVPNLMVWLIGFYALFHCYLNILGELTCFGDRLFYMDWWNSTTTDYFWRSWNIPVHRWMVCHVYNPLIRTKVSRGVASVIVFFISALLHEYIVTVAFRRCLGLAFVGMMAQLPLGAFTRKYSKGHQWGNVIFWMSIMLGQPLCVLMYYHKYQTEGPAK